MISYDAGQINRHKNQSTQPEQSYQSAPYVSRHVPSHRGWAPYSRGRGRGRGRPVAPHRHRTLVLNNGASGSTPSSTSSPGPASDNDGETRPSTTSNGWVAKHDRHMQLINSAVYDKEKEARAKAMEESRKMKEQRHAQREEMKVLHYAQGPTGASVSTASQQILVNDVPFKVMRGGSKLVRVSSMSTPQNFAIVITHFFQMTPALPTLLRRGSLSPALPSFGVRMAICTVLVPLPRRSLSLNLVSTRYFTYTPTDSQALRNATNYARDSPRPVFCFPTDHAAPPSLSLTLPH